MAEEYQPIAASGAPIPEVDLAALNPTAAIDPLANLQQSMAIGESDRIVRNSIADLKQSLSTPTADEMLRPIGYDPIETNRDRYVNSDYFGELGFNPFSNNEEIYGNAQTNFNKLKNAFTGMGALAWHQAVDQFKSWGNTFDVLGTQEMSSAFQQAEMEELSRRQNEMLNANPIFETQADRESIFNFNTIANTVQQSGFAVGAIAEIAAEEAALTYLTAVTFGGASELQAARTIKLASNIGKAARRTAELSESINSASNMRKAFNAVQKAAQLINPVDNVMEFALGFKAMRRADELAYGATKVSSLRTAARGFGSLYRDVREFNLAVSEAKAEAAGTYTELSEQMTANFETKYGRKPTDLELKDINDEALRGAQSNGAANTALILMSNKLAFGNILKGFKPLRYMMDEDIMKGLAVVSDKDALKLGKKVIEAGDNRWLYYKNAIVSNPLKYLGANLSEALQENAQSISNDAVKSWYMAKYNGQELDSKFDAIREAAGNQFTTEGAKTFISGFFTGGLLGAGSKAFEQAGSIQQYFTDKKGYEDRKAKEQAARTSVKNTVNQIYANPLSYNYNKDNAAAQANFAAMLKESAINKDKKAFNDIQDDATRHFILTGINTGMLDLLNDRLTDYVKNLNENEFTEAFGVEYTKENHADMVKQTQVFAKRAEEVKEIHSKLSSDYANPFNPGNFKHGTKEYIKEAMSHVAYKEAINQLTFMQDTYNRAITRQQEVLDGIKTKPGFENVGFNDIYSLTSISHLANEIDLLRKEAEATEDKKIKAEKEKKIKQLDKYNDDLISYLDKVDEINANKELDPKKKSEELTAALDAFTKEALPTFTSQINDQLKKAGKQPVQDNSARAAFENLTDYFHLQGDHEALLQNINYIVDPINFSEYLNRHNEEMVKYFENKMKVDKKNEKERARDKRTAEDALSGAVVPEDGEGMDVSDLTEEDDFETEVPNGGSINVEELVKELKETYAAVVKSQLEIVSDFEGSSIMLPSAFLGFSNKATQILVNYGVSNKDFTFNIARPDRSNYQNVEFTYTGAKSSNSANTEVEDLDLDVETIDETTEVTTTPEPVQTTEPVDTTTETPVVTEPVTEDENVDPEQEEFDNNPENSTEVNGTKFILGHYIVLTDGSDTALKIISVTPDKVWAIHGTESELEFTTDELSDMLTKGQIQIVTNPTAKKTTTPVEEVTETQKKDLKDKKAVQEEDADFDDLEYTADNVGFSYARKDSDGSTVYEDSRTPISSGSKINNSSDNFTVYTDKKGVRRLKRGDSKESYPLIMGTSRIKFGTPLTFEIDVNIDDFDDYDYVQQTGITKRKKADFFNVDGSIKPEAIDDFPVAIYTVENGKKIKLGYLPTVKFVTARYNDSGVLAHTKEFTTTEDGDTVNNLEVQTNAIKEHRKSLFNGYNTNPNAVFTSSVTFKSNGVLRTDGVKKPLIQALSKNTRIAIIKQGRVHVTDKHFETDLYIPEIITQGKSSGWPVAIIPTPSGKSLASLVTVPQLKPERLDFILGAWTAFHTYNTTTAKSQQATKKDLDIIKAVYKAYDIEFIDGETADFKTLSNYINDYVTHTSSVQYNPMLQGKGHFNITPKGLLSVWKVNTGDKKKDSVVIGNLTEISEEKINKFYDIAANLRQSIRFGTEQSAGVGNDKMMTVLSVDPDTGVLTESKPMTYNDYMLQTLETTLEEGRPYDENNTEADELVHFANPVVVFGKIDSQAPSTGAKPTEAPKAPAPVTSVAPVSPANGVAAVQFTDPSVQIKPIIIEGSAYNVVNTSMRPKALVDINGTIVPFYITSGLGGKGLEPGWYPFFGIGKDGWMNKTDKSDMETYYERYWGAEAASKIKGIAEELNAFYGTDSKSFEDDKHPTITEKPLSALADAVEDHINEQLSVTPALNNGDARKVLRSNVEQLGKEITAKQTDKVADSAYINVTDQSKSETALTQEEALAKFMDMDFGQQFGTNQTVDKDVVKGNEDELKSVATTTQKLQEENKLNKKCN